MSGTDGEGAGARIARAAAKRARAFGERPVACPRRARSRRGTTRDKTAFRIPTRQFGKPSFFSVGSAAGSGG